MRRWHRPAQPPTGLSGEGLTPQAARVVRPVSGAGFLIVASPHSGRHYPDAMLKEARLDLHRLRRTEDAWVDTLLERLPRLGASTLTTDFARTYVDLNRAADELDPLLIRGLGSVKTSSSQRVQVGLGVIPRTVGEGLEIYRRRLSFDDAVARLETAYHPYHAALSMLLADVKQRHGQAVFLDLHSMPADATDRSGVDVVLGDRFGTSCDRAIVETVTDVFQGHGLKVVRNTPFAGGYATRHYGHPLRNTHALQIEISRRVYMDEVSLTPKPELDWLKEVIVDAVVAIQSGRAVALQRAAE